VRLYDAYHDAGLELLLFPCNQFGAQEPGTPEEIKEFVAARGVTFPMMAKIDVVGESESPVYTFLKDATDSGDPTWNFDKYYVVSRTGDAVFVGSSPGAAEETIVGFLEASADAPAEAAAEATD